MRKIFILAILVNAFVAEAGFRTCVCPLPSGRLTLESGKVIEFSTAEITMQIDDSGKSHAPFSIACKNAGDKYVFNYGSSESSDGGAALRFITVEDLPRTGNVWAPIGDGDCRLHIEKSGLGFDVVVVSETGAIASMSPAGVVECSWPCSLEDLPRVGTYSSRLYYGQMDATVRPLGNFCAPTKERPVVNWTRRELSMEEVVSLFAAKTNVVERDCVSQNQPRDLFVAVYAEQGYGRFIVECVVRDAQSGSKILGGTCRGFIDEKTHLKRELSLDGVSTNGLETLSLYLRERAHGDVSSAIWPWSLEVKYAQGSKSHVRSVF